MAAIYLFGEALTTQQICAMHRLGPGYKVSQTVIVIITQFFFHVLRLYSWYLRKMMKYIVIHDYFFIFPIGLYILPYNIINRRYTVVFVNK